MSQCYSADSTPPSTPSSLLPESSANMSIYAEIGSESEGFDDIKPTQAKVHPYYGKSYKNITFCVENTLFEVNECFFQRDSAPLRELLSQRGRLKKSASLELISLDCFKITSLDFERFLGVLFPIDFSAHSATSVEEWTSVLDLAVKWEFQTIRTLAINELTPIATPIDKIVLGHKYEVNQWLLDAYKQVCERSEALTREEGHRLGIDIVTDINKARQAIRHFSGLCPETERMGAIRQQFGFQLSDEPRSNNEEVEIMECSNGSDTDGEAAGPPQEVPTAGLSLFDHEEDLVPPNLHPEPIPIDHLSREPCEGSTPRLGTPAPSSPSFPGFENLSLPRRGDSSLVMGDCPPPNRVQPSFGTYNDTTCERNKHDNDAGTGEEECDGDTAPKRDLGSPKGGKKKKKIIGKKRLPQRTPCFEAD